MLYHERRGSGPRLLFLNGSGATLATSAPLIDAFVADFDVLAYDQRGIGRSVDGDVADYAMADLAADAVALLEAADERFSPEWLADHPTDRAMVEMFAARIHAPRTPAERRGELAQLGARSHHDVWDRLGAITCPTFVGCGRFDGIAPVANGEGIASRIPGAELHVYEGGHPFWFQDAAALPDVIAFLGR